LSSEGSVQLQLDQPLADQPLLGRPALLSFLAGILAHLPVLGAFWNQDDWGLLARAAGLLPEPALPVRLTSQVLYWRAFYPLFGLDPDPYTVTRLLLHGGSAALVADLARLGGLGRAGQLAAGLLYGAGALCFTPLYWAAGVQELLGVFLALAALWFWRRGGRFALPAWVACGALAILAKESALLLPLLLVLFLLARRPRFGDPARGGQAAGPATWAGLLMLGLITAGEASLVLRHFETGAGSPYALGPWYQPLLGLSRYGWWLVSPGPFLAPTFDRAMLAGGAILWLLWGAWSIWSWRSGRRWPAACLAGGLLSLAPALPLRQHVYPYLALGAAAAGALTLSEAVFRRSSLRFAAALVASFLVASWAFMATNYRIKARTDEGLSADPLVLRAAVSHHAVHTLRQAVATAAGITPVTLILLQPVPRAEYMEELAERLGESWVSETPVYGALEGTVGPRLVLPESVHLCWANDLDRAPPTSIVLADGGIGLLPWGDKPQALLYLTLTEVARGQLESARRHLLQAAHLSGESMPFLYDPDVMLEPPAAVRKQAPRFRDLLGSGPDSAPLTRIFQDLLDIVSPEPAGES
jgi:hypothetical protein